MLSNVTSSLNRPLILALLSAGLLAAAACGDSSAEVGTGGGGAGTGTGTGTGAQGGAGTGSGMGGAGTGTGSGTGTGTGLPDPTEEAPCGNQLYDCGDLVDNDNDGLTDYQDPDCLGPCDNTEDSFFPDLPGTPGQKCDLDCFWDTGQGHEEDCYWNHQCDPYANDMSSVYTGVVNPQTDCSFSGSEAAQQALVPPNDPGSQTCNEMFTMQSQMCLDECRPLAPNGCDCFGCCELGGQYVWVGSLDESDDGSCDVTDVGTAAFLEECHPCTPVPGCNNPCDTCELCIGKTTLPPECFGDGGGGPGGGGGSGGAPQDCPEGQQACGLPGQDPCPSGNYCITGCCVPLPQ